METVLIHSLSSTIILFIVKPSLGKTELTMLEMGDGHYL